jgi:peptide/nickel transport system ATP-binding protein
VRHTSDRVAVMYVGQLVETAAAASIFARPRHPYTAALMKAVPVPDPRIPSGDVALQGEVPNPASPPPGCYFHPRCPFAVEICRTESPALRVVAPDHLARCHRADELALEGIGTAGGPATGGER